MAKQIIYGEEARKALEQGVNQLADRSEDANVDAIFFFLSFVVDYFLLTAS